MSTHRICEFTLTKLEVKSLSQYFYNLVVLNLLIKLLDFIGGISRSFFQEGMWGKRIVFFFFFRGRGRRGGGCGKNRGFFLGEVVGVKGKEGHFSLGEEEGERGSVLLYHCHEYILLSVLS